MKADYNSLLYAYESNYSDILSILNYDIALEAEGGNVQSQNISASSNTMSQSTKSTQNGANAPGADRKSVQTTNNAKLLASNTSKNPNKNQVNGTEKNRNVGEKIKLLLEKIGQLLQAFTLKLQNRIRLLNQTDKGFTKMYYSRKAMVKPYEQVKVVSYAYNNAFIDNIINKMMGEITTCLDKLRLSGSSNTNGRISEIVTANQANIISILIKPYVKDNTINTIPKFTKYITENFRGQKKELLYRAAQLPLIEKYALSSKDVMARCEVYQRSITASFNRLKNLEYMVKRNNEKAQLQDMMMQNVGKASLLFNAYTTILHLYFELKLEESLNYRELLKRFYQF